GRAAGIGAGDDALEETCAGEVVDTGDPVHVAGGDRVDRRQVARFAGGGEAVADRLEHRVWAAETAGGADGQGGAAGDERSGVLEGDDLTARHRDLGRSRRDGATARLATGGAVSASALRSIDMTPHTKWQVARG